MRVAMTDAESIIRFGFAVYGDNWLSPQPQVFRMPAGHFWFLFPLTKDSGRC